jgi:hypothetical protein
VAVILKRIGAGVELGELDSRSGNFFARRADRQQVRTKVGDFVLYGVRDLILQSQRLSPSGMLLQWNKNSA